MLEFITLHPFLVAGTALMLVAVLVFEVRLRSRASLEVSVPEAVRMINKGANVVDVREPAAYEAGHIIDALSMKPEELRGLKEGKLKKKRGILVVCDDGGRSHRCARVLQDAGYTSTFSLRGGLNAWVRENQPLVTGKARPR